MSQKDWKDLLNSTKAGLPDTGPETPAERPAPSREDLVIRFEKRNGKPATIISNFTGSEQELKELAARLKKHCGVGGAAKDDEILIQGDVRAKAVEFLRREGHKVRGDLKRP